MIYFKVETIKVVIPKECYLLDGNHGCWYEDVHER